MNCPQISSYETSYDSGKGFNDGQNVKVGRRFVDQNRRFNYQKHSSLRRKHQMFNLQRCEQSYGYHIKVQRQHSGSKEDVNESMSGSPIDKKIITQRNWQRLDKDDGSKIRNCSFNKVLSANCEKTEMRSESGEKKQAIEGEKSLNQIHEMKKQILKELMAINNIPAGYFLLGKEATFYKFDIGIDSVAELVDISTNQEGDIVIKPNEASVITYYSLGKKYLDESTKTSDASVRIRKLNTSQKVSESPKRKLRTTGNIVVPRKVVRDQKPIKDKEEDRKMMPQKVIQIEKRKPGIKIWHEGYTHLENHPINRVIRLINSLLVICGKIKNENTAECQREFIRLANKLELNISKKQITNPEFFKAKENIIAVKDKLLHILYKTLNKDNEYSYELIRLPKYFVGDGNNPMLVKSIFKQRWWWLATEFIDSANLVWTQWKKNRIINLMPMTKNKDELSTTTSIEGVQELDPKKKAKDKSNNDTVKGFLRVCNHLEGNVHLGNKKAMFYNLKIYYESIGKNPFDFIPLTFHIKEGIGDKEYEKFSEAYHKLEESNENVWIIKPGENSNRGKGIILAKTLKHIEKALTDSIRDKKHTFILQKYIERPLLFNRRKFDIRCYGLLTAVNGHVKGYFYKEGYLRTASKDFSLKSMTAKIVHLTNEAVQVRYDDFGKFEPGNKLTYNDLQKYLETTYPDTKVNFFLDLLPQIKAIITDTFRATHGKLDPLSRLHTFEVFGYDFMIDADFHVYLIEANINPCLEIISPVTARIVPSMVDNSLRIAVDPLFQPLTDLSSTKRTMSEIFPEIKHELVYDSKIDNAELQELKSMAGNVIVEVEEDEYDSGDDN